MPPEIKDVVVKETVVWKEYRYRRNASKLEFNLRQDIPDHLNDYIALLQEALKEVKTDVAMNFSTNEKKK